MKAIVDRRAIPSRYRLVSRAPAASVLFCALAQSTLAGADVTIAFVGDQGWNESAREVLQLIEDEGSDMLVALGDLGYEEAGGAEGWIRNIEEIFEPGFPVLGVVGNHENREWPTYQAWLAKRAAEVPDLACEGTTGVKEHCSFRGVSLVQVAPGIGEVPGVLPEDGYPEFIEQRLADDPSPWRICNWHKNQRAMQTGVQSDDTGWGVYQSCLKVGGIVATAHEHAYSRTYLMSDYENQSVIHREDHLELGPGRSFAFVSGLGGNSVRTQQTDGDWWASVWTQNQGGAYGALFCTFGELRGECRFVDITGAVPDRFTLESSSGVQRPEPRGPFDETDPETGDQGDVETDRTDEPDNEPEPSAGQASSGEPVDTGLPAPSTDDSTSPGTDTDGSEGDPEGNGEEEEDDADGGGGAPGFPLLIGLLGAMIARTPGSARR